MGKPHPRLWLRIGFFRIWNLDGSGLRQAALISLRISPPGLSTPLPRAESTARKQRDRSGRGSFDHLYNIP